MPYLVELSIVVPCYNEEKNIPLILECFKKAVRGGDRIEVLLVNNGSTDNSREVFTKLLKKNRYNFCRVVSVKENKGYGHGILKGLKEARGGVLAWTHADMQTDPLDVIMAYKKLKESGNLKIIVKGKRVNRTFGAWLFTFGMSCIASIILRKFLYDINAQPKVFHRSFFKNYMKNAPHDFALDLFLLYVAKNKGYSIYTVPVKFSDRQHGESKWAFSLSSKWKTVMRTIKYIFVLSKNK